jgi:hypothetical protein
MKIGDLIKVKFHYDSTLCVGDLGVIIEKNIITFDEENPKETTAPLYRILCGGTEDLCYPEDLEIISPL